MLSAVTVSDHRAKDHGGEIKNASETLASNRGDSVLRISASPSPMNDRVPVKLTTPGVHRGGSRGCAALHLPADPYPRCRRGRYALFFELLEPVARRSRSGKPPRRRGNSINRPAIALSPCTRKGPSSRSSGRLLTLGTVAIQAAEPRAVARQGRFR